MKICSRRQAEGVLDRFFNCSEHFWTLQPLLISKERVNEHPPVKTILHVFSRQEQMEGSKLDPGTSLLAADPGTISAILSLWLAVLARRNPSKKSRPLNENETARQPQFCRIISHESVPHSQDIKKWLSSQTTLHKTTMTRIGRLTEDRQAESAPVFGISFSFSFHRVRFGALAKYVIPRKSIQARILLRESKLRMLHLPLPSFCLPIIA